MGRTFRDIVVGVLVCAVAGVLCGCNVVGPSVIKSGRGVYGEAITETNNQQMLRAVVKSRYRENTTLLAVTSVTANVRVAASAGANFGIGSSDNYRGNLVPLSVGVAYEENPTISYVPVETPAYFKQLLSPIALDEVLVIMGSIGDRPTVAWMLLERLNRLKNPLASGKGSSSTDGFARAVEILDLLLDLDVLEMVGIGDGQIGLLFHLEEAKAEGVRSEILELFELLELADLLDEAFLTGSLPTGRIAGPAGEEPKEGAGAGEALDGDGSGGDGGNIRLAPAEADELARSTSRVLVVPVRFSAVSDGSSIALTTRSVYDLVRVASMSVQVPDEHVDLGMVEGSADLGLVGELITIHLSEKAPKSAYVAVRVHDYWYYIDDTDRQSKLFFNVMSALWTAEVAMAKDPTKAPVLTVPVSR